MQLVDMTVLEFNRILGSDAPAPGGGSASALAGSLGSSLIAMVSALTEGKKKYAEHQGLAAEAKEKSLALQARLLELVDADTAAFNGFREAMLLPKETEEEKRLRHAAMQEALKQSTQAPMEIMLVAREALEWAGAILGKSNQNAGTDLGVAALCLRACLQGAWLNVLVNAMSIDDADFVQEYKEKGEAILESTLPLAEKIYTEILHSL